jgi:segregation and condensation protein A
MSETFSIHLPQFEGPFDLLLFFIERDELEITDIPIAKITEDFLAYIHNLKLINIDLASEFILVAASLMKIKSKMLLPRKELDAEGKEIDPREELVQKLLEYKKYKEISAQLGNFEEMRQQMVNRGNAKVEFESIASIYETDSEMESLTLYKLLKAFEMVLKRHEIASNKPVHEIAPYKYSIEEQKELIQDMLHTHKRIMFEDIFASCENRVHAIFQFLAVLELIQEKQIDIIIGEGINNFWISPAEIVPSEAIVE